MNFSQVCDDISRTNLDNISRNALEIVWLLLTIHQYLSSKSRLILTSSKNIKKPKNRTNFHTHTILVKY